MRIPSCQLDEEADARKAADLAAVNAAEEAKRGTLKQFLSAYVTHLEQAWKDVLHGRPVDF